MECETALAGNEGRLRCKLVHSAVCIRQRCKRLCHDRPYTNVNYLTACSSKKTVISMWTTSDKLKVSRFKTVSKPTSTSWWQINVLNFNSECCLQTFVWREETHGCARTAAHAPLRRQYAVSLPNRPSYIYSLFPIV